MMHRSKCVRSVSAAAVACLMCGVLTLLAVPPVGVERADAAFPGTNGKIAFVRNVFSNFFILTMETDGSNQTQITSSGRDSAPAWSADGERIVFESSRNGNFDIYAMDADGSNQVQITSDLSDDRAPSWSPDGTKVAFQSVRDGNFEIYIANADGSNQTRVTFDPNHDQTPVWSPDGGRLAFVRGIITGQGFDERQHLQILTIEPDGTDEVLVVDHVAGSSSQGVFGGGVDWSPDGARIAFYSNVNGGIFEIYVVDADGTDEQQLTSRLFGGSSVGPAWSPDGTKIAFDNAYLTGNPEVFVMDADGTDPTQLTTSSFADTSADWQPLADPDADGDGVSDASDLCPATPSGATVNADGCSPSQLDGDGDGVSDASDNCPFASNPSQADTDGDGLGDACDTESYTARVQQPINADGSSTFNARRGVVPVKFTLELNGTVICELPPATIHVLRLGPSGPELIDESVYVMAADNGSNFRISGCQYVYNLGARPLGPGDYEVQIRINGGTPAGTAHFTLA